jgi:hypothetical protein
MPLISHARWPVVPALLLALAAGCRGAADDAAAGAPGDSATAGVVDGVPREQLQRQAEPLTPEQAQAMGIDSAIGPTRLEASDSGPVPPPGALRDAELADSISPP